MGVGIYLSGDNCLVEDCYFTVSLKMRSKDLVSTAKGSPTVWLQFTNETGQHRRRAFLVGRDDRACCTGWK